ncbi:MAG: TetR/AcrR family transcriptional regulator [Cohaesibacter sp.]|jgi:AcrR family transcriptional regulator|nr:TetR/AcrR family transcriptional regulator [Cohaesibacter sp.]
MVTKRKKFTQENRSTRDLILDIAEQEIAYKGVEGLRLKDVADQVGVQLPSIYAHFSSRKDVLEALAERLMDELLLIYYDLKPLAPKQALMASAERTIDFYITHRGYGRLLLADFPSPFEFSVFNKCGYKIQEVLEITGEWIKRGAEEGTVRDIRPDLFLSFRMGVTLFPLFMRSDEGRKEMVTDAEVIEQITQEAERLLELFINPSL